MGVDFICMLSLFVMQTLTATSPLPMVGPEAQQYPLVSPWPSWSINPKVIGLELTLEGWTVEYWMCLQNAGAYHSYWSGIMQICLIVLQPFLCGYLEGLGNE